MERAFRTRCNTFGVYNILLLSLLWLTNFTRPSLAQPPLSDELAARFLSGELPVADFSISLPKAGKLNREGASELPDGGIVLDSDFVVPRPSKIVLPAGTRIEQRGGDGWANLIITGPDGTRISYTPEQLSGLKLDPSDAWKEIQVTVPPLTPIAEALILEMQNSAPTIDEVIEKLEKTEGLSDIEGRRVLSAYVLMQRPTLSTQDICLLYRQLRASIETMDCKWVVNNTALNGNLTDYNRVEREECRFAMDGERLYLSSTRYGGSVEGQRTDVYSYSGATEKEYLSWPEFDRGSIIPFRGRDAYFSGDHPLWTSMLISNDLDRASAPGGNNIEGYPFYPLEKTVVRNGIRCVPCVTLNCRIFYLDPSRSYAIIADECPLLFDSSSGRVTRRDVECVTEVMRHVDCKNGLWLPAEVKRTWKRDGRPTLQQLVTYTDISVNQPVQTTLFEKVFPEGVLVIDTLTRQVVANELVAQTAEEKVKRVSWFQGLMICNLVAVVLFFVFYRFRSIWRQ